MYTATQPGTLLYTPDGPYIIGQPTIYQVPTFNAQPSNVT